MKDKLTAFVVARLVTVEVYAQNKSSDDLARRTLERRAIEAVNWACGPSITSV